MKLPTADIQARLAALPGWQSGDDAISRQYTFPGFPDAVAFVTRLGFAAEAADHHPDLLVSYKRVTVTWSTHSEGGVTAKDFDGARQSDMIAGKLGGFGADARS
jgi:4a-hydroxytetrahydrobiopterin dehydratase